MSSAEAMFAAPVTEMVGKEEVEFQRLSMIEYGQLEAQVRKNRSATFRQLLDECKLAPADRFVALRDQELADASIPMQIVDDYLRTFDGAKRAVELSLKKTGRTPQQQEEMLGKLAFPQAVALARVLVGFAVKLAPPKSDEKEGSENPQ